MQDINLGGRTTRTQYQYTLQDPNLDELNTWAPRMLEKLKPLPELRDVNTDAQTSSTQLSIDIDRDQAARFGIQPQVIDATLYDAFGQRQVAQYFTQLNSLTHRPGCDAGVADGPAYTRQALREVAGHRAAGAALDIRQVRYAARDVSVDQSPEPVSGGDAVLQPCNRASRSARPSMRSTAYRRTWGCRRR